MRLNPYPCFLEVKRNAKLDANCLALTSCVDNIITVQLSKHATKSECCHEAVHVRQFVEQYIEQTLDDESQAYLEQFIYDKLIAKL